MNKKQNLFHLGIGASSIFMIFVVLVMFILAILAYLQADSYYRSTLRQANITASYYESESILLEQYYQLDASNLEKSLSDLDIDYQKEDKYYIIKKEISEKQVIQLSFVLETNDLKIISLKVVNEEV